MDDFNAELGLVDADKHQAPVDIRLGDSKEVTVPDLMYRNYEKTPVKMKLNNTGYTVTVSGKFEGDPPTISGGPLGDSSYKFSQLHFHWGPSDDEGSEHTFEGRSVPLEMHVVHVNQKYDTQEKALVEKDGVVILAFLFISGGKHAGLDGVARGLAEISKPHTSFKITPQPLQSLCTPFQRDCFSYWGSVISPSCSHLIQWFVCRDPLQASPEQFAAFRRLLNVNEEPLLRNYRDTQALKGRTVFHLTPGSRDGFTLNCSPDKTSVAPGGRPTEPGQEASVLSVERPCTSLEQAESKAGVNLEEGAVQRTESGRELVTTPSGRLVHKTASGRMVEKTASGRLVEKTASGRLVERTASGRLVEKTASGRLAERTASGRLVEKTASGRLVERTPSGHLVQKTASGRLVEKTPSGRLLERTPSGRLLQRTASGNLVETTRTLAVPDTQTTPSGHQLETTPSGRLVERTPSGRELERTPSGRLMTRTASGRLVEASRREAEPAEPAEPEVEGQVEEPAQVVEGEKADSAHQLDVSPSGAVIERTASGREMVLSPSGNLIPRVAEPESAEEAAAAAAPEAPQAEPVSGAELGATAEDEGQAGPAETAPEAEAAPEPTLAPTAPIPSGQGVEGSPSGRLPSMGSRVVSFSQLTGPIKQRAGDTWPDAPYTGPAAASPIFLDTNQAARLPCPPLQFLGHFQSGVGLLLTNSGETVEISLLKTTERPVLQGGPLQGRYILDSAHFHWLPNDDASGGTHTINNSRAEIECHLVHIHEDYKSKTEAMDHPNGLAVVSILHQVGGAECEAFQRLCKELPRINELYTQVELPGMDLSYMASVVKPHEYFLYPGRFFGREDGKALVWIVYAQPVGICCKNVAAFQSLKLSLDFRQHDTYPLGERPLFAVIAEGEGGPRVGGGEGEGADAEEELAIGDLRRTASGRVHGIAADEWPNAPFQSKHDMLMAPLDIKTSTVPSVPMPPLEYRGHFPAGSVTVEMRNTGEAVDITWKDPSAVPTLVGGPLTDEYVFDSAHFHWAQNPDDVGAMHRINGKRCDLEFHMVHFKKSLKTRLEAMVESDGLAVTSFLIRVGGQEDESFAQLTDVLPDVKAVEASTELSIKMDWLQHRAGPHGFFTYPGTLFGADQAINVIWMVYPTPVQICCQHVARFYQLQCLENNRIHPLHEPLDRPIFHSINPDNCTS